MLATRDIWLLPENQLVQLGVGGGNERVKVACKRNYACEPTGNFISPKTQ